MKDAKATEESLKAIKSLPGAEQLGDLDSLKNMFQSLILPKEEISKGKTWSNKIESKTPLGKQIIENHYTYDGAAEKDGTTFDKILVKPDTKIEPDPNAQIKIAIKDTKGSGHILFHYDNKTGRMAESVVNQPHRHGHRRRRLEHRPDHRSNDDHPHEEEIRSSELKRERRPLPLRSRFRL